MRLPAPPGLLEAGKLGPLAILALFAWSLGLILLAPPDKMLWAAGLCLLVSGMFYPAALKRLFNPRWLLLLAVLVVATALSGKPDARLWGVAYSQAGLLSGLQMALRAVCIFLALSGFSSAMDVSVLAGLIERLGLHGLGFSIGVAMNILPGLQRSAANTWHSLWMRGGLRRQRRRALRFFMTTLLANALRQAEEIALAAESRAYTPERSRVIPLQRGAFDLPLLAALGLTTVLFFML